MAGRYRILLLEDSGGALVPVSRRSRRRRPAFPYSREALGWGVLLEAVERLRRQGPGPEGWRISLQDDPVAFLLDSVADAILVRSDVGEVIYANPVAERMALSERSAASFERFQWDGLEYERRSLQCRWRHRRLILEVASRIL
ncbi:MAG: hypothetical protein HY319_16700 [Armatimonadetes bacterium]|nr:hypothetical protein [Armatimonadota bacterium]